MSKALEIIRRRQKHTVTVGDDQLTVRAMTHAEWDEVQKFINDDDSFGYVIGKCVLESDGSQVFQQAAEETPQQFGARILKDVDISLDIRGHLVQSIFKLSSGKGVAEKLEKNS